MSDDDYKDLVLQHDKNIDKLATSIEHIAGAVGTTNRKIEDVLSVISQQNVLMEKFANMETTLKESFNRVHVKIRDIETKQNETGCPLLVVANKRTAKLEANQSRIAWTVITVVLLAVMGTVITKAV
jgi:phosphopantetheinyl transferase (holo-ACP synthase)